MKSLLFCVSLLLFATCNKSPQPVNPNEPKLLWRTQIGSNGTTSGSIHPYVSENGTVLFSVDDLSANTEPIISLDKNKGNKQWEWKDYQVAGFSKIGDTYADNLYLTNNNAVIVLGSKAYGINLSTGKTIWHNKVGDVAVESVKGLGNTCFQTKVSRTTGKDQPFISKCDVNTGDWKTIFQDTLITGYEAKSKAAIPYIDKNGDTIVVYTGTHYRYPPNESTIQFLQCFNVSKNKLLYKKQISPRTNGENEAIYDPIVKDNKLFAISGKKIVVYNLETGNKEWDYETKSSDLSARNDITRMAVSDGKILFGDSKDNLYCLNESSKSLLWQKANMSTNNPSRFCVLNGVLYYVFSGLNIVDVQTGDLISKYKVQSDNSSYFLSRSLTIDAANKRIYAHDFKYAYCFEAIK